MNITKIIRYALRAALSDAGATDDDRRQAEQLLECLVDSIDSQRPKRKMLQCEIEKSVRDASLDQRWREIEERHYDQLKLMALNGLNTQSDVIIALVCVNIVLTEMNLRKGQRLIDTLDCL